MKPHYSPIGHQTTTGGSVGYDLHQSTNFVSELLTTLGFQIGDDDTAFGEIMSCPTTLTVLGDDPLALVFAFWAGNHDEETIEAPTRLKQLLVDEKANLSLENGFAWLSLYDVSAETAESIIDHCKAVVSVLRDNDLSISQGCVVCGSEITSEVLLLEGKATRVCLACIDELYAEQALAEEKLNQHGILNTIALPAVFCLSAAGWTGLWLWLDVTLLNQDVVVNEFTVLLLLIAIVAFGALFGIPLGMFLRRSGFSRLSPRAASILVSLLAVTLGEFAYIAISILRAIGVFDLKLAANMFLPIIESYSGTLIFLKLAFAVAMTYFCTIAAGARRVAALKV